MKNKGHTKHLTKVVDIREGLEMAPLMTKLAIDTYDKTYYESWYFWVSIITRSPETVLMITDRSGENVYGYCVCLPMATKKFFINTKGEYFPNFALRPLNKDADKIKYLYIHDLCISKEIRDKGYGSLLIGKAIEASKKAYPNIKKAIGLSVNGSINFWERVGFKKSSLSVKYNGVDAYKIEKDI